MNQPINSVSRVVDGHAYIFRYPDDRWREAMSAVNQNMNLYWEDTMILVKQIRESRLPSRFTLPKVE